MCCQIGLLYILDLAQQAYSAGYDCNHLLQLLQPLVAAGDTGKMCGKGFYTWLNDRPVISSDNNREVAEQGLLGMTLCLHAAVETSNRAPNVDYGLLDLICVSSVINFPPQEGGPFHYFCRNPKTFAYDDLVIDPDAAYSTSGTILVREVEAMGPCLGMSPLPIMVPGYSPNITLLLVSLVIVVFVLILPFL